MSHRENDDAEAPNLLSLMMAPDGGVLPHVDCVRSTTDEPEFIKPSSVTAGDDDLASRRNARRKAKKAAKTPSRPVAAPKTHAPAAGIAESRYVSVRAVAARYSVSIPTVWRWTKDNPEFPQPLKIGAATRWSLAALHRYEQHQESGE